jgi:hypothetical protein
VTGAATTATYNKRNNGMGNDIVTSSRDDRKDDSLFYGILLSLDTVPFNG